MSPKYRLTYFNIKGLGEAIRLILTYMAADWEDVRVDWQKDWEALKPSTPFGKLPLLDEDGRRAVQSVAIARYLGKKAGLGGSDNWEDLQIDIIADTLRDIERPIFSFWKEVDEEKKAKKRKFYLNETLPFYFSKLDRIVKENGGFLANKKLSWVDFMFVTHVDFLNYSTGVSDVTADYPHLHRLKNTVLGLPRVSDWVAKRPFTEY